MYMLRMLIQSLWLAASLVLAALPDEDSWEYKHMKNEHHLQSYDDDAFFRIHDLDRTGVWTRDDIASLYGVLGGREQDRDVGLDKTRSVEDAILKLIDTDGDETITRQEYLAFKNGGGQLPDLGFAGHHEDEETEFDIHHVEIFHSGPGDDDESKWNHPEDIACVPLLSLSAIDLTLTD